MNKNYYYILIGSIFVYGYGARADSQFTFLYEPDPSGAVITIKTIAGKESDRILMGRPIFGERHLENSNIFFDELTQKLFFVEFDPDRQNDKLDINIKIYPIARDGKSDPWKRDTINIVLSNWPQNQGQLKNVLTEQHQISEGVSEQIQSWLLRKAS